jgi:predicted phosphodiesterase
MRIAIMADIHGNAIALDAILDDIERGGGVDVYWVLGDIVALGPAPVEVLERLAGLPNARCVRGNTERYVCTGDRPSPSLEEATADPALLPVLLEVAGTFAWTQGAVTNGGWLDWLSGLPAEVETTLPDGTRVLGLHVAPGREDGPGFAPGLNDTELAHLLGDCDAGLLFGGHTHESMDVQVGGTRVVNVGSVSNPVLPDLRAEYAVLEAGPTGHRLEQRRVEYDRDAVIAALERLRHPGAGFIIRHMRGLCEPYAARPELHDPGRAR